MHSATVKTSRTFVFLFLLFGSTWAALVNGQPFFMADTTAYIRGPDFAVVYFLGNKFATAWTQERTLKRDGTNYHSAPVRENYVPLNSPFDQAVLGGRSIYYGALLYLGHISSYLWLAVFVQAGIFLYLSYTFIIKCGRLSFSAFACITFAMLIATPVSFFTGFLMPDIFASFLILSSVMLLAFWNKLPFRDRLFICAIVAYSVLTHASHLLLLFILALLCIASRLFIRRATLRAPSIQTILLCAIALFGFFGEFAFSFGTQLAIGAEPIRPPFLMARLIDDGPGYLFLQKNCTKTHFIVCNYLDRLPTGSDGFLWSKDPNNGVYNIADLPTRRALSSEQPAFVVDVFLSDPIGVFVAAVKNTMRQLIKIGLGEFFHSHEDLIIDSENLPAPYAQQMLHSNIGPKTTVLKLLALWFSAFYFVSIVSLSLVWIFWRFIHRRVCPDVFSQPEWFQACTVIVMTLVLNAAICGVLSGPHDRYQTRIAWIPLFFLLALAAKFWRLLAPTFAGSGISLVGKAEFN